MIGLMSVSIISSCRVRKRPAMKSAASTFSSEFFSFVSNSFSISTAVDSVITGAVCVVSSSMVLYVNSVLKVNRGFQILEFLPLHLGCRIGLLLRFRLSRCEFLLKMPLLIFLTSLLFLLIMFWK